MYLSDLAILNDFLQFVDGHKMLLDVFIILFLFFSFMTLIIFTNSVILIIPVREYYPLTIFNTRLLELQPRI